jgi:DNA polymerase-3 subunit epsilon
MILFDTETTGLPKPMSVPLDQQPRICEIAILVLNDETLEEVANYESFIKPGIPMPPDASKINGITDAMLKDAPTFARALPFIEDLFLGQRAAAAHNCGFDMGLLELELRRLGREFLFPWPSRRLCTVELTMDIRNRRMKQEELYQHYFNRPAHQTHRAMGDVRQLLDIVREMRKEGRI